MTELERYKKKLETAEQKVRILEDMIEVRTRELYMFNQELERKNKDLELFTHIAAHDLQEPLISISNFSDLLLLRYGGQLDERAQKYLNTIINSSTRMREMVRNLMTYNDIGVEKVKTKVDCHALVMEVQNDLADSIERTQATFNLAQLPSVSGYETELRLLFQNLISNAIKFRKKDTSPIIKISSVKKSNEVEFIVEDNGIGILKENEEKIFLIFQRVHSKMEYEGTGIGLAHCKKIVDHHNGQIWVEGVPDVGCAFHFTMPLAKTGHGM
ncbi:sensor histidine kinase [Sediminicola sp. 1XM1-17]|uniref:sensor histidine kinase n=1 Tax=Sediminicola sp. 1XM1-17 TaxID=3127702 RepID=UPI00307817A8